MCDRDDRLAREISDVKHINAEMLEALEAVEWVSRWHDTICPWCEHSPKEGHAPDCRRQLAIAKARGE